MKLLRFGPKGREKPGVLDKDGVIRDLSGVIPDIDRKTLGSGEVARLKKVKPETLPKVTRKVRIGPPIAEVRNFIAIGLNYADHARETGSPTPAEPIVFNKAPSSMQGPNDDLIVPKHSKKMDWEVELAVVIAKGGSYIAEKDAISHVAGYTICNDVSEREWQIERGGSWIKGKSAPTFGPIGPWLVTTDEIRNPQELDMFLDIGGKRMQTGNTRTMIFSVAHLISYCSHFFLLEPGDIITTGTPPGVGQAMKPPRFLKDGDTVRLGITGLGEQNQKVVAYAGK
jgi:2-keto-4-pentenoate hydratase/2-oxohepta-3-ene-1,7-dioic acid hydratase in catechol pathway